MREIVSLVSDVDRRMPLMYALNFSKFVNTLYERNGLVWYSQRWWTSCTNVEIMFEICKNHISKFR